VCGRDHDYYESMLQSYDERMKEIYRAICSPCRKRYRDQIMRHRLTATQAIELITLQHCQLCGERLRVHNFRKQVEVDHDHAHCNGEQSCGKCIRGFVCKRCNLARGQIDALVAELGAARVITLINEGPIP
jgi:hypothetical protein